MHIQSDHTHIATYTHITHAHSSKYTRTHNTYNMHTHTTQTHVDTHKLTRRQKLTYRNPHGSPVNEPKPKPNPNRKR
ncbi:hypothetical protein HanRHA438_Chr10g0456401 [Helianthus annuus]|nr:hypothetical protein HanIR_Chr10g0478791 [Helianthus annuus]KAJ0879860.1 hypothetical protein HanRHA438_Chr10g0456401 [Helianthus annuus]